jgi:hypothetical protein
VKVCKTVAGKNIIFEIFAFFWGGGDFTYCKSVACYWGFGITCRSVNPGRVIFKDGTGTSHRNCGNKLRVCGE